MLAMKYVLYVVLTVMLASFCAPLIATAESKVATPCQWCRGTGVRIGKTCTFCKGTGKEWKQP
jgi:RecJ-like exonuclease